MKLSKVTTNKAARLGMDLYETVVTDVYPKGKEFERDPLWIFETDNPDEMEPIAIYRVVEMAMGPEFFYHSALNSRVQEECPQWISSEQHLRDLLPLFKGVMAKGA
jgi:hypothetical protein